MLLIILFVTRYHITVSSVSFPQIFDPLISIPTLILMHTLT